MRCSRKTAYFCPWPSPRDCNRPHRWSRVPPQAHGRPARPAAITTVRSSGSSRRPCRSCWRCQRTQVSRFRRHGLLSNNTCALVHASCALCTHVDAQRAFLILLGAHLAFGLVPRVHKRRRVGRARRARASGEHVRRAPRRRGRLARPRRHAQRERRSSACQSSVRPVGAPFAHDVRSSGGADGRRRG